ncbi:hypothetical protein, partial [Proteus mirabilis]
MDFTPAGIPLAAQEARRDYDEGNYVGAAANAASIIPAGLIAGGVRRARNIVGRNASELSSRYANIYDPPHLPQRPFELDYPGAVNGSGPLKQTIDGAPITARFFAGRRVAGGADEGLA